MNCHQLTQHQTLIFWGQKCGATCIKEILMHIESEGTFFDNSGKDDITHKIYEKFYKSLPNYACVERYANCKIFCFIRNPYHRIISLYLDKYVAENSPTPEIANQTNTFDSLIRYIASIGFNAKRSKLTIFEGFFPITSTLVFSFFQKLIHQRNDILYFVLDQFLLPDGKLVHKPENIKLIYQQTQKDLLFDQIRHILEENWKFKKDLISPSTNTVIPNLSKMPAKELRVFLKTNKVSAESFYSDSLISLFNTLYFEEICLFNKIHSRKL
jgi:hypothetical protein